MNLLGFISVLTVEERKERKFLKQMEQLLDPYLEYMSYISLVDSYKLDYVNNKRDWGTEKHFVHIYYSPKSHCTLQTGYVDIKFGQSNRIYDEMPDPKKIEEAFKFIISQRIDNAMGSIQNATQVIMAMKAVKV